MPAPYNRSGLVLAAGQANDPVAVRALQHDLRALGYLRSGIDGVFGAGTRQAVRALQFDLLNNDGTGSDGPAPVSIKSFNVDDSGRQIVTAVTDQLDVKLAGRIEALLADPRVVTLPRSDAPQVDNQAALRAIAANPSTTAPSPFILAIVDRESGSCHFHVPSSGDDDTFVTVGLDRNDANKDCITSRGYGVGQYTLFHHPPRPEELHDVIADPVRNAHEAYAELRDKFDRFVAGPVDSADDRTAEHPLLPLRLCRYRPSDSRYMSDCRNCAVAARKVDIEQGAPVYAGASLRYEPTQYYASASYGGVPDRADFLCDWPYAVRRYNGSGVNSFHYQTIVLKNLLAGPARNEG